MSLAPTLYLTRNGLLEPLGQSQVLGYLRGLSKHHTITLITYEKDEDWFDPVRMARAKADCVTHGIRWLPQRFRGSLPIIGPLLSMIRVIWLVLDEQLRGHAELIHARSYIPAAVALAVNRISGAPFIFDMRALWPEELITAGRLRRGSPLHRAILAVERHCLARASAVVVLTHAVADYLRKLYPTELEGRRIEVIPTCADLDRFTPAPRRTTSLVVHGCIGTVMSGWFRTDWLTSWMHVAAARDPGARFEIVTRDPLEGVREVLDPTNELAGRLSIGPRATEDMPDAIRSHDVSVMFFSDGLSKLGSAPTRMAEVLGCGLPVVVNEGVGDVAEIVRRKNVGVIVEGPSTGQMEKAFEALQSLLHDPDLPERCRATAEAIFSLKSGTEKYRKIYTSILESDKGACAD